MSAKKASKLGLNLVEKEEPNTELITRVAIEKTPFFVIGVEEGYFGCIGKYRITEPMETEELVREALVDMTWDRIVQVVLILIETQKK